MKEAGKGVDVQQGILEVECKPRGLWVPREEAFQGEECFWYIK